MHPSTVLLFLLALVEISQGTIYWPQSWPEELPNPAAKKSVYDQLEAINKALDAKNTQKLSLLINDKAYYMDLKTEDFDKIFYVGDCFFLPNASIRGRVYTNEMGLGVAYKIVLGTADQSPTGYIVELVQKEMKK